MTSPNFRVRRAVIDDLPGLIPLWRSMNFSPEELDQRLTEFQVATDGQGNLLGAVAFGIAGQQGRIHHEAFSDFGLAEQLRPLFLKKIQILAQHSGVFRLWTQEDAPFWKQTGLQTPSRDVLQKLPAQWNNASGRWLTLQLKDEAVIQALAMDQEFAALMQAEREKIAARARMFQTTGMVLAILIAVLAGALMGYVFHRDPTILQGIGSGWRK